MPRLSIHDRVAGCIIGSAVGDAFGGPMECVPAQANLRCFGDVLRFEDMTAQRIAEAGEARGKAWWNIEMWGQVTDDTVMCDLLLDAILRHDGQVTAYEFAREWERFEQPVTGPDGRSVVRLNCVHWIERIPYYRNRLRDINKRELGRGEANATNALMFIAPVGLLYAGDPLSAELAAIDIGSVNQHGRARDVAAGYCAALAACFLPDSTPDSIIRTALHHTRDERSVHEIGQILAVARRCGSCREFVDRYWTEILGHLLPMQDWQHHGAGSMVSWNNSEVLGVALGMFHITRGGEDGREMLRYCALNGRDADTVCRVGAGLLGAWRGLDGIPKDWRDFVLPRNAWLGLEEKSARLAEIVQTRLERGLAMRKAVLGA